MRSTFSNTKGKSNRYVRFIMSCWDYYVFSMALTSRFKLKIFGYAISIAIVYFFPRSIGISGIWHQFIGFFLLILPVAISYYANNDKGKIKERIAENYRNRIMDITPSSIEEKAGFRTYKSKHVPSGPVVLSHKINLSKFSEKSGIRLLRKKITQSTLALLKTCKRVKEFI